MPGPKTLSPLSEKKPVLETSGQLSYLDDLSEEMVVNFVPARLEVIRPIRPKYACKTWEGVETEGATVKIAPTPKQIIEKSIASPGILAHIITAKFVDAPPFYRQEKQFARLGYELSRSNMTNWTIQLGECIEKLLCYSSRIFCPIR
jgi:transposase